MFYEASRGIARPTGPPELYPRSLHDFTHHIDIRSNRADANLIRSGMFEQLRDLVRMSANSTHHDHDR